MKPPRRRAIFLAPRPYRRRRLRDAARLLPVLGVFFFVLPALWSPAGQGLRRLSGDVIYFFTVWALLIGIAAIFARGLSARDPGDEGEEGDD